MSGEVAQVAGEAGRTETGRAEAGRAEEAGQASAVVRTTTTFEELLEQDGRIIYKTKGSSMRPMLHENRDIVVILRPEERLHKYDVALYRRGKQYVLHRVVRVLDDAYLIRGDNTYALERVPDEAVIGVLGGFSRKGTYREVSDRAYRAYVRVWCVAYPVRAALIPGVRLVRRAARRLGLLGRSRT
ncbi:MAG: S24/S26 family peptidase [Atopobiaceae bacterium]|nr:S24/S26 family peptidase [Atopobiaceae bacterium]MBR3313972.1 S24/S26 family peptidase [Atopobiaceae bacterium]